MFNKIKIVFKAYDVKALDSTVKSFVNQLSQMNSKFVNPIPLPTKNEFVSLPIAPNRYKSAQEQFIKSTHRRFILIDSNSLEKKDIDALNKFKGPTNVNISWVYKKELKK